MAAVLASTYVAVTRLAGLVFDTETGTEPKIGIIAQVGPQSFTLRLPDSMRTVHPVYHVSMLEPHTPSTIPNRTPSPPPPVVINDKPEYEITEIVDSKYDRRYRDCQLHYKVRWSGYEGTDEEFTWEKANNLEHAQEAVADFHKAYPDLAGPAHFP